MKHFLTPLLFLIGLTGLAQPTYLDLDIQLDNYPSETSWLLTQGNDTLAYVPFGTYPEGVLDSVLIEETFFLEAGLEYKFYIFDAFGDGNCCGFGNGWVSAENDCQGVIFEEYNFNSNVLDFSFTLDPCEPNFNVGCTNPVADNYDPEADDSNLTGFVEGGSGCNQDGWSQNYIGINLDYYNQYSDLFTVGLPILFGGNQYYIDLVAIPGNCNSGVALVYVVTDQSSADGNFGTFEPGAIGGFMPVGTLWQANVCQYTPGCTADLAINFNPDASLDDGSCIFVTGCTNSESPNFNPAAVIDDGSCIISVVSACGPGEIAVTIEIELDQYAGETGWSLKDNQGNTIIEYPIGTYAGSVAGTIITEIICLPENTPFTFFLNDAFGDGLGGEQWGGQDGSWIVYTICEVLSEGSGDFGDVFIENTNSGACDLDDFTGCTDDNYLEFDPLALISDSSLCVTEAIEGCINPNAFNFDPEANTMEMIPSCNHTLVLTDWASNSWSGAFLILAQGDQYWGPFTLLSGQDEFIFDVELSTDLPVKAFFYTPGNAVNSANQCQFQLLNPIGDIALEGGSNPFTDPMIPSPYMYIGTPLCGPVCIPTINGCLDEEAYNFNPDANTEDICYYHPGCMNPGYVEYYTQEFTPDVEPEGACQTVAIFGCTNPDAFNFEEEANTDNGTCIPKIYGCTNELAFNYDPLANTPDGSCIAIEEGCTNPEALNYNSDANTEDFSCILPILGCTDPEAFNFNLLANTEDGSCIEVVFGCTDETAFNYDPTANTNVGCESIIEGCTDPSAFNFSVLANTDDGNCIEVEFGCMDPFAFNFEPNANTDNGSCEPINEGCTDPTAFNYELEANTDDGSCEPVIEGCTDPTAFNYEPTANADNGDCIPVLIGCTDSTAFNYNELANTDFGCIPVILGCIDQSAVNYNEFNLVPPPNTDDGSCFYAILGCTEEGACNYNELANTNDGTCEYLTCSGCTDLNACNYDPTATINDNNCEYPEVNYDCDGECLNDIDGDGICDEEELIGCTDDTAFNFVASATDDDGSCLYDAGCSDTPGEPYWLNDVCFAWVINDVTPGCCGDWSESCQGLYNLCQDNGIVTSIEALGEKQIIVYPNPTRDHINIASNLRINAVLYNSIGQPILQKINVNQLDLSPFEAGIYNLVLTYGDLKFTKKIIKQ